jgi:polynucleotide 5'-hydroxyl-kinase GRC3/NOL9
LYVLTPDIVSLVKGPANVRIIGKASILGKDVSDSTVFIQQGRLLPFETDSSCKISIILEEKEDGDRSKIWMCSSFEAGTKFWKDIVNRIISSSSSFKNLQSIMLVGPTDSGKTTLSTYIINEAIRNALKPAIIDADIGQGDLAPPNAIGCGIAAKQILDLREVSTKYFAFIGSTNPTGFERLITRSVKTLFNKLKKEEDENKNDVNLIIINTDGYITGNGLICKVSVANELRPHIIICLGENSSSPSPLVHHFRSYLSSTNITVTYAMSASSNNIILKRQTERRRQRLNQLQRYIPDFGKVRGKSITLSLKKIKFVYRGLTYFKGLIVGRNNDDLILVSKRKTILISKENIVNMFVGLGLGDNVIGFGIISNIFAEYSVYKIAIQTNIEKLNKIYLSNTGISKDSWQPYVIDLKVDSYQLKEEPSR